ncbi:methionine adenosyltransferase sam2 [Puccinia graminis f. sp. tritici]|uniref:Methionine adenosyltransferase sam2 n=1 Tax=Puccinia graminis f. sp. tritici TaxID=56615 RepID=A0A5B0SF90_PUCGR|nr:methionine adenosyltransferase sam2 [Puccinia graminis f. sp. tritici]
MPLTLVLAHQINTKLAKERQKEGGLNWLRLDSKTQVMIKYKKEKDTGAVVLIRVDTIIVSTQHSKEISTKDLRFVIGGPQGDAGLTGQKIIINYWSKVNQSGAYLARWIAKSIIAVGLAQHILVQLSYAIGVIKPLSTHVDSYGKSKGLTKAKLVDIIRCNFDLRPGVVGK